VDFYGGVVFVVGEVFDEECDIVGFVVFVYDGLLVGVVGFCVGVVFDCVVDVVVGD